MPGDTGRISYYQKWRHSDKHITLTQTNIQLLKFVVSSQKQLEWQETSMVTSKLIRVTNLKAGTTMQGTQWICSLKYMHLFLSQFLVGWKNCWEAEVETFLLKKKTYIHLPVAWNAYFVGYFVAMHDDPDEFWQMGSLCALIIRSPLSTGKLNYILLSFWLKLVVFNLD